MTGRTGPRYLAIVEALAEAISRGELEAGARMPTHRELAGQLGVTVGTVTRAYAEAARRGLVVGETGRGTFIRTGPLADALAGLGGGGGDSIIDLSLNLPPIPAHDVFGPAVAATLQRYAGCPNLTQLFGYQPPAGADHHRAAGAAWIARSGLEASAQRVLVCSGALHAMTVVFSTLTGPGDTVLTESLTYPGMKNLASLLHLRLQGLPMDGEGIIPDSFERACRNGSSRVLYCVPTIHNPLGIVMPESRRREIAAIARAHEVAIVEDDVHSFMLPDPPVPLSAFAPECSYYIRSTSKSVAGGMRIGYLLAPERAVDRLATALRTTVWMAVPLMAEMMSDWIRDGTVDRIIEQKRKEARARQLMARRILQRQDYDAHPLSYHLWLKLPEPWRSDEFIPQLRKRGVLVTSPNAFVPGRGDAPHAVRVCLGATRTLSELEHALGIIARTLSAPPVPAFSII